MPLVIETINFRIDSLALNRHLNSAHSVSDIKLFWIQAEKILEANRAHTLQNIVNSNLNKPCYIYINMVKNSLFRDVNMENFATRFKEFYL